MANRKSCIVDDEIVEGAEVGVWIVVFNFLSNDFKWTIYKLHGPYWPEQFGSP